VELVDIDTSRIVNLVKLTRPAGQLFLPDASAKLAARYEFRKFPGIEQLLSNQEFQTFGVGKFQDCQIQELRIYGDGVIVDSKSDTDLLDAFLDDFIAWFLSEFKLQFVQPHMPERHHESTVTVRTTKKISSLLTGFGAVSAELNKLLAKENYKPRTFLASGFNLDADPAQKGSRRKEMRFVFDRKANAPYEDGLYYSQCPLPTKDHLALLDFIESLAS